MGDPNKTLDEMYSDYLVFIRTTTGIETKDLIVNYKYEYLLWSIQNNSITNSSSNRLYKLHKRSPLKGIKTISKKDYSIIESHYQFLKLKYG